MSRRAYSCAVVAGAIIAYIMIFPDDLTFVERLLKLIGSIATGAYALLIVLVLVGGAVRIWGRRAAVSVERTGPA